MTKETCCVYRRKILVLPNVLSEEACGVPDAVLADVLRFDLESPTRHPVLAFNFCPWCGKARDLDGETRIADVTTAPTKTTEPGYAKCGGCSIGFEYDQNRDDHNCPKCGRYVCCDCRGYSVSNCIRCNEN